jgi:hypothetical protein
MPATESLSLRRQPLYDSNVVTTGFNGELVFFATPTGQADNAGVVKTIFESNNTFAGQLPKSEIFDVDGIAVSIVTNTMNTMPVLATVQNILECSRAYLQFRIDRTVWFEAPLYKFTSGHGLVVAGVNSAVDSVTNGSPAPKAVLSLGKNVVRIPEGRPFDVVVRFQGVGPVVAEAAGVRLYVFLDGMRKAPTFK